MTGNVQRTLKEGVGFGLVAGAIFAMMEVAGAAMMGDPPAMPIRMFASVVLGKSALEMASAGTLGIGLVVHFALSAAFGAIYGAIAARLTVGSRTRWGRQVAWGLAFGAMLWLVNFQVVARFLYPWFLTTPQVLQMAMHAMFFGLPLGLMIAAAERRVQFGRMGAAAA